MSLMECIECGGQVSDQAMMCPHCGYTSEKMTPQVVKLGAIGVDFGNWFGTMLKVSIASIPVAIVLAGAMSFFMAVLVGAGGSAM